MHDQSSYNLGFDPYDYLSRIDPAHIKQYHLAGHTKTSERLIDNHGAPINDKVWDLFNFALKKLTIAPTCIEWDNNIPAWDILLAQISQVKSCIHKNQLIKKPYTFHKTKTDEAKNKIDLISYQNDLWNLLTQKEALPDQAGASVHQNNIIMQRYAALAQVYPCCQQRLGVNLFKAKAVAYINNNPSTSADITNQLERFIPYLFEHNPDDSAIEQLACFEHSWYQVFHGVNHPNINLQRLAHCLQKEDQPIHLQLTAGLKLLAFPFAVLDLWASYQDESKDKTIAIAQEKSFYAMHQRNGLVLTLPITAMHYQFLKMLTQPITVTDWCYQCKDLADFQPGIIAYFYQQGLICITHPKENRP